MDELERCLSELSVGTSEYGDDNLPASLLQLLSAVRKRYGMDVVFVAKISDGRRTFMAVDAAPERDVVRPGMSDPVEQSWCHNIVQGRLPELIRDGKKLIESGQVPYTPLEIGTHLSVPVILPDGSVYGTLCTFAFHVDRYVSDVDVARLREVATAIGAQLSR